jgi:transcriptional regulator of acetoin/glycerol metabolism
VLATAPGPVVEADDLPLPPPIVGTAAEAPPPAAGAEEGVVALGDLSWAELDRAYVMHLLRKNRWNVSRAARQAGLNRSTFDSRMKKMGIDKNSVD